jgi:hypothetical protein
MKTAAAFRKATGAIIVGTALAVVLVGAACGGDGGKKKEQTATAQAQAAADTKAVEANVGDTLARYNAGDAAGFAAGFTSRGLGALFGVPEDQVADFIKSPDFAANVSGEDQLPVKGYANTTVDGDTATTEVTVDSSGAPEIDKLTLMRVGDNWKIDNFDAYAASPPVPSGYQTVEMKIQEFAFGLDITKVPGGKVNFNIENIGKQDHEAALVKLADGLDWDAAVASLQQGPPPDGIEMVGRVEIKPGRTIDMVLDAPLDPGRYAFVCMMPDTAGDGAPHAMKGMVTRAFTVE